MGEHGAVAEVFKNMVAQTYFNEFIGSEDLNLHNNIKRGNDGHAGIIQVNSSNIPTRLLLEHEIEGSLVIRIDGKVYHRPLLDKIIPWSELIEAGSINSLFPSK